MNKSDFIVFPDSRQKRIPRGIEHDDGDNELFCLFTQGFPASHLIQDHRIHFLKGLPASAHDDIRYTAVHDHLGAEETRPYLGCFIRFNIKSRQIESTSTCKLPCLQKSVHLGMDTTAPLVIGAGGDTVLFSPAAVKLGAVHLFPRGAGIARGDNGIELVHDDCTKVPPEAGALVGAPRRQVEEILMPVRPHEEKYGRTRY
jgi:hypothetical protein